MIEPPNPFDSVIYRPSHVTENGWDPEAGLFHGEERGVVKSVAGETVFVWFTTGSTAAACRLVDLHEDTRDLRAPTWYTDFEARSAGVRT